MNHDVVRPMGTFGIPSLVSYVFFNSQASRFPYEGFNDQIYVALYIARHQLQFPGVDPSLPDKIVLLLQDEFHECSCVASLYEIGGLVEI